jgi:hypothetical protein
VPDGEVGELHSLTSYVFDGYWRDPDKTREAMRGAWCSVGDLARRDADGFIHLVDRKSNMIISGGTSSEVEAVLAAHPGRAGRGRGRHARCALGRVGAGGSRPAPGHRRDPPTWRPGAAAAWPASSARAPGPSSGREMPRTATGKIQHRLLRQQQIEAEGARTMSIDAASGASGPGAASRPATGRGGPARAAACAPAAAAPHQFGQPPPSPSSSQLASTLAQASTIMLWPQVRRPFSCSPPCAGAST